jgi:hypothetical protein
MSCLLFLWEKNLTNFIGAKISKTLLTQKFQKILFFKKNLEIDMFSGANKT